MKDYPFIIFTVLFIVGIIIESLFDFKLPVLLISWGILILLSALLIYFYRKSPGSIILDLVLVVNVLLFGASYYSVGNLNKTEYPFKEYKIPRVDLHGTIESIELERPGKIVFIVATDSLIVKGKSEIRNLNVLCRIMDEEDDQLHKLYDKIEIGNHIRISGTLYQGRNKRNPGEFDYRKYLTRSGIHATFSAFETKDVAIINDDQSVIKQTIFSIRKSIDGIIREYHITEAAGLIRALILADRSMIDYDLKEQFVNAGVVHVLAVSGLHVGFVVLIFLFVFNRFNIFLRFILTIAGILFFLIITGSPPSVFRASVMAIVLILSFLSSRSYNSINSLAIAAFIILLIDPTEIFNPGFQLSFSAVLSIILLYPFFKERINKLELKNNVIQKILLFLSVSLSAQIGTLPFTLIYFNKLSVAALFANLVVIPLIGGIVGIGILTVMIGTIWSVPAIIYASANNFFVESLFYIVGIIGRSDLSHISIFQFSFLDTIIFYILITTFFWSFKRFESALAKLTVTILITGNMFLYLSIDNVELLPEKKLSILAVDVGQGDGFLIKFPNGETALIDAGNATEFFDNGERVILPLLNYFGIDKINHGFISHVDADHYKGFISLIRNNRIEKIYKPAMDTTEEKDVELEKFLNVQGIPFKYYSKGIIKIGNCQIYVLNDTTNESNSFYDSNNRSGIIKIVYGQTSFLFLGDAENEAEEFLISSYGKFLDSDYLKVGHHGSRSGTSEEFLKTVSPEIGLISAGIQNQFRHPSKKVVSRLENAMVKIHRTDKEGAVLIQSDGEQIEVVNWRGADSKFLLN